MSKVATFTTPAVVEWMKLFPRQVTETYTSSVTFMKQLTTIALGTILHTKNLFPADCFLVEKFCGMEVMSLKKNCTHEMAQFISEALIQAFDAFDKKYLDQLVICFYEGERSEDNILEYYVFQYTYNREGVEVALNARRPRDPPAPPSAKFTFDHVRHKTEKLIQTCVLLVTQFGRTLPHNYDASLRLYYNEHAPGWYQAPGYSDAEHEPDHLSGTLHDALHLGSVSTPHHHLHTHLYIREELPATGQAVGSTATRNTPSLSQMEPDYFHDSGRAAVSDRMDSSMSTDKEHRSQYPCSLDVIDEETGNIITRHETTSQPIHHKQRNKVIPRFFHKTTDIVDQLIAETNTRDTPHDPVDEILTPIEKVDLQKDTVVGDVVTPKQSRGIDDTLKEYRDAITMLNMKENTELPPLSGERNRTTKRRLDAPRGTGVGTKRRRSNDSSYRKLL